MLDILSLFFGNRIDIPGHIGFLLMAVSLFLTNILWLRVFLILSFAFLIVYFALTPTPLYTGIAWMSLFIAINLYRLKALLAARRIVDAVPAGALLRDSLADLDDEELSRLISFGELVDLDDGAVLIHAGDAVGAIYLVASGKAEVEVGGKVAARLGRGAFIGEVAFLADAPSTATIRAAGPLQVVALDTEQLRRASEADPHLSAGIYHAMGRAMARKLLAVGRQRARA